MSFLRHGRSIGPMGSEENRGTGAPLLIVRDESHRLSLGGLVSTRARFRYAGRYHLRPDCGNLSTVRPLDFRRRARQTINCGVGQIR